MPVVARLRAPTAKVLPSSEDEQNAENHSRLGWTLSHTLLGQVL
jgi:hypothetical protein